MASDVSTGRNFEAPRDREAAIAAAVILLSRGPRQDICVESGVLRELLDFISCEFGPRYVVRLRAGAFENGPQKCEVGPGSHGNAVNTPAANAATQSLSNTDAGVLKK